MSTNYIHQSPPKSVGNKRDASDLDSVDENEFSAQQPVKEKSPISYSETSTLRECSADQDVHNP